MAPCGGNCHGHLPASPRHLLIAGVGNLLLGSFLTQHGLPYPLPDGLDCPGYGGQGLLSSTASTGGLWVRIAAMAHPWHPTGKPLCWEPSTKVWVCKLVVINFSQSSKGRVNWITLASVYQERRCGRSISWHIPLPIYSPNLIIRNRAWLKHQENTFMSLACKLEMSTEKLKPLCFWVFCLCPEGFRYCFVFKAWSGGPRLERSFWLPVLANRFSQQCCAVWRFTNVNVCWFLATNVHLFPHPTQEQPQLCFWVTECISYFSSQKSEESLCSGVGWWLFCLASRRLTCVLHTWIQGCVTAPFEEDMSN